MESNPSTSDANERRAFYLPATAALGRLGRRVRIARMTHLWPGRTPSPAPTRSFYTPAMAVVSSVPGRVERFVTARLRNRDLRGRVGHVAATVREFYLPATFRR